MADLRRSPLAARLVAAAFACLTVAGVTSAQTAPGKVVLVPSPINQDAVTRIRAVVDGIKPGVPKPVIVFDFSPNDKPATTGDDGAGAADDLAELIRSRPDVLTVATVRQKVSGHSVLPVLACDEIIAGPQAQLGEVVGQTDPALAPRRADAYTRVVGQKRSKYLAVARKMFDKNVQLRRGTKNGATWFVDLRERDQFAKDGITVTDTAPLSAAPDGAAALFNATQLRDELELSKASDATLVAVTERYRLPPSVVTAGGLSGRAPVGFRYTIRGAIDAGVKESVARVVADAARNGATVVVLQLEAGGGDPQAARDLADRLIEIQAKENIKVVAFVPDRAPDTAAIVALGCSEIVLSRREGSPPAPDGSPDEAVFGDFDTATGKLMRAENAAAWTKSLRDLAERRNYPPLLIEGLFNPDIDIVEASPKANAAQKRYMTAADVAASDGQFVGGAQIKAKGQLLTLKASDFERFGLGGFATAGRDPNEVYTKYGLDPAKVKDAAPAWLDRLATFLKLPAVTVLLVVIGFIGLILEMKVPGTTLPGIVAALCFILVFWAHTQFSGQVAVLAGLLFILGLVLVLLEVFVLPGFGVPGILGIVFILGALGLATLGATDGPLPSTTAEWTRLGGKMGQFMFAMIGAVAIVSLLVRYLPHIPGANRLTLAAPDDSAATANADVPGASQAAALLGAVGITMTVLRPAGSVRFGDDFVDVVSEGSYVPAGSRVQVVEVEGNRIVVREV